MSEPLIPEAPALSPDERETCLHLVHGLNAFFNREGHAISFALVMRESGEPAARVSYIANTEPEELVGMFCGALAEAERVAILRGIAEDLAAAIEEKKAEAQ
jgi:hypothetical protein